MPRVGKRTRAQQVLEQARKHLDHVDVIIKEEIGVEKVTITYMYNSKINTSSFPVRAYKTHGNKR